LALSRQDGLVQAKESPLLENGGVGYELTRTPTLRSHP
jgi:hypothetical protein